MFPFREDEKNFNFFHCSGLQLLLLASSKVGIEYPHFGVDFSIVTSCKRIF